MIQVQCKLPIYNIDGIDMVGPVNEHEMTVESYIGEPDLVTLIIEGHAYVVRGTDLIAATENAQNVNRP